MKLSPSRRLDPMEKVSDHEDSCEFGGYRVLVKQQTGFRLGMWFIRINMKHPFFFLGVFELRTKKSLRMILMEVDINLSCGSMKLMKHSTYLSHTSYNPWRLMAPPNMLIPSRFSCKTHSKCVSFFCADDKPAFLQLKHRILKMRR